MERNIRPLMKDYDFNYQRSFIGFNCIAAYHLLIDPPYSNPLDPDPYWKELDFVLFVLKGSIRFVVDDKVLIVPENSFIFGKHGFNVGFMDNHCEAELITLHFQSFNYPLPLYKVFQMKGRSKELDSTKKILKYFNMKTPVGIGSANAVFSDLMFDWIRQIPQNDLEKNSHYDTILQAETYINSNIENEDLTVTDLAARFNFCETHFRNLFKKIIGISPKKYIEQVKMERALSLLQKTNLSITEIAGRLGFASSQHFSSAFKKFYYTVPSECRDKNP